MHVQIEIIGAVQTDFGISNRTGKEFSIRKQPAVLHTGSDYPQRFMLAIGNNPEYPAGVYDIAEESFLFDTFGGIKFHPRLIAHSK